MFEQTFKNIDDILHKDAGCGSELDYVEQTSWVLFLKYLDDLEKDKATAAELTGKAYTNIIAPEFQWSKWAAPKISSPNGGGREGAIDHHAALTGDDLADFVNIKLFPYLKKFKADAESADTIEYKIGEIFSELKNRIQSGYNLREVINRIDELRFRTHAEKHEMSHLYEDKIKNMGNAGRNGGEYYTPRPLIKTIVKVVAPEIGQKIYDGAVGSAGFLVEAFEYLKHSKDLSPALSKGEGGAKTFSPLDILDYIYAVLHSPTYREKYKEFLKIDFPRVPYPTNADTFNKLVALGGQLRKLHLLESAVVNKPITQYPVDGSNMVGKPRYDGTNVFINENQYFANVPLTAWEFYIGGYQPAQKWLKDRKGRVLEFEDILHYQKIIVALVETARIMREVDEVRNNEQ